MPAPVSSGLARFCASKLFCKFPPSPTICGNRQQPASRCALQATKSCGFRVRYQLHILQNVRKSCCTCNSATLRGRWMGSRSWAVGTMHGHPAVPEFCRRASAVESPDVLEARPSRSQQTSDSPSPSARSLAFSCLDTYSGIGNRRRQSCEQHIPFRGDHQSRKGWLGGASQLLLQTGIPASMRCIGFEPRGWLR